ncbi:glycosyltransferase [Amaricoccus solimangrovi]|uniref:Glycosyltransferase family 1 protein n=1 Tax=Amaricoccus solimangrovi TaxID=2589815 RepID=A0A501WH71_9RHOB|nr:glycosyltransferase [Amaricoccus solimangrovi]TPE46461.1 glycosyltransferase family 1 protein [Amaricoccus solimangrovi]
MARIVLCLPALSSHAAVHGVLARELARRGHDCRFVGAGGLTEYARREDVALETLGFDEMDMRSAGLWRVLRATARATRDWIERGPDALARLAPDLVVADQAEPGASLAAEAAGLPRVTMAVALPLDRDEAIPPPFVGWPMLEGDRGRRRNRGGWRVADALMTPQSRALAAGCRAHGLPVRARLSDWISPELDLRQWVPALDFPHDPGAGARPVGPLRDGEAGGVDLPDDLSETLSDDGRPLVFASLGTLQGGRAGLFRAIAGAAEDLGVRLLLAHAGGLDPARVAALPGRPLVRAFWPQRALLARVSACVTHAGLNTVLDCVAHRVPMVAVPLAFEQPAIAARLAHHGVARVVPGRRATRAGIREALASVLGNAAYSAALRGLSAEMASAGGAARAADYLEGFLAARGVLRPAPRSAAGLS